MKKGGRQPNQANPQNKKPPQTPSATPRGNVTNSNESASTNNEAQKDIEKAEVAKTLHGLMYRCYYEDRDQDSQGIKALREAAAELGIRTEDISLEYSMEALEAARNSGVDMSTLSGRDLWVTALHYEQPQSGG